MARLKDPPDTDIPVNLDWSKAKRGTVARRLRGYDTATGSNAGRGSFARPISSSSGTPTTLS